MVIKIILVLIKTRLLVFHHQLTNINYNEWTYVAFRNPLTTYFRYSDHIRPKLMKNMKV